MAKLTNQDGQLGPLGASVQRAQQLPALAHQQILERLQGLGQWQAVTSPVPGGLQVPPATLRRSFRFQHETQALQFLQSLVEPLDQVQHHPAIENLGCTAVVAFTTWDAGNRLTTRDFEAAKVVDEAYAQFNQHFQKQRA